MTATTTIADFIARNGLLLTATRAKSNPALTNDGWQADHWECRITDAGHNKPAMVIPFSCGTGRRVNGVAQPPTLADVLGCLASDSASVENSQSFDDWCADFGYDTDSRKAERTYNACKGQAAALRTLLGDTEYETLLWNVERL